MKTLTKIINLNPEGMLSYLNDSLNLIKKITKNFQFVGGTHNFQISLIFMPY